MEIEIVTLTPDGPHRAAVRTIDQTIRPLGQPARCFALLVDAGDRPRARALANLATAVENAALTPASAPDLPTWFQEFVRRVNEVARRTDADLAPSACLGVVGVDGDGLAISLVCAGVLTARIVRRDGSADTAIRSERAGRPLRFTSTLDGHLGPGEHLVFGTAEFHHAVPNAMLTETLARLPRERSIPYLLRAVRSADGCAAGIVVGAAATNQPVRPQESMTAFLTTAATTKQFLTPTLGPTLREYGVQLHATLAATAHRLTQRRGRRSRRRRPLLPIAVAWVRLALRTVAVALRSAAILALDTLRITAITIRRIARLMRRGANAVNRTPSVAGQPRWRPNITALRVRVPRAWEAATGRIRALPRSSQILLACTIGFGFLFLLSTTALWRRSSRAASVTAYRSTIAAIDELRSLAEARLLFNDRTAAREALREAEVKVATLPRSPRHRRLEVESLAREVSATLDRARLLTRIHQPLRIARAGDTLPFLTIADVALVGDRLVALSTDGVHLANVEVRDGTVTAVDLAPSPSLTAPIRALAVDDRAFLLIDGSNRVALSDRAGAVTAAAIDAPPGAARDASFRRRRLYLLHPDGTVTRHDRTAAGFARGERWLAARHAPKDARTIAASGLIAIGAADGTVTLYANGARRAVDLLAAVDPKPTTAPLVAFGPDDRTVYLGDPADGRIIAVTADGKLIGQVQSDAFRGMSRIVIDPQGPSIYILSNDAVYVIVPPKVPTK